jgi:ketosteroid isomerase-like protein
MTPETFGHFVERIEHAFRQGDPDVDSKTTEAENVRLLRETYEALARGEIGPALERFHEEVELEITGPPAVPFLGRWQGRLEVGEAVARNFGMVEDQRPEIRSLTAQGDTVVVIAHERGRVRETGAPYALHWVQLFQFRDGRIARVLEVIDGYSLEDRSPA